MKKIALLIITLFATFAFAQAQEIKFGPRIGIGLSKFNISEEDLIFDDFKSIPVLSIGGVVELYDFIYNISFQGGLLFNQKGFKLTYEDSFVSGEAKITISYLEVPLLAHYNIELDNEMNLKLGGGPYLAFAVGGKTKSEFEDQFGSINESESLEFGNTNRDDFNGGDFGLNLNAGIELPVNDKPLYVQLNYAFGLSNIATTPNTNDFDSKVKTSLFSLSATYFIGSK